MKNFRPSGSILASFLLGLIVAWGVGQAAAPKKEYTQDELFKGFYPTGQAPVSAVSDNAGGLLIYNPSMYAGIIQHVELVHGKTGPEYVSKYIMPAPVP